jgi:4'-phosphopantetheinyl transferase
VSNLWEFSPATFALGQDKVHVWRASLNLDAVLQRHLTNTLSPEERARADHFHLQTDRAQFIAAHGLLRTILSRCLGIAPAQLRFSKDTHGKPRLAETSDAVDLRFNLSHSHGIALVAVAEGREVGVDIERKRPDMDILEIAGRFFSPDEFHTLRGLPEVARKQRFFQAWVRKEAFLKAIGKGLSGGLNQPDAAFMSAKPWNLIATRSGDELVDWKLRDLSVGPEYAAALAVRGGNWELHLWSDQS